MGNPKSKTYDCVQSMRQIRDGLSGEIATMTYDELVQWLRSHHYTDPFLQRLSDKAVQQAAAAEGAARRR